MRCCTRKQPLARRVREVAVVAVVEVAAVEVAAAEARPEAKTKA